MYCGMCGGKMIACKSLFSPSGMWIFKMGFRSSGSIVGKESNFTPPGHLASLLRDTEHLCPDGRRSCLQFFTFVYQQIIFSLPKTI